MAKIIIISGSGYIANSLILYLKKYNYLNIIQLCRSNPSIENIKIIQTENYLDFDFESYNEVTLIYTNGLNQLESITKKDFANYIASELPVLLVKKLLLFTNKVNLIYFSSVNVYNDGLIGKGVYFESSNLNSKEDYGMSKIAGEKILLNNINLFNDLKILRLGNIFGLPADINCINKNLLLNDIGWHIKLKLNFLFRSDQNSLKHFTPLTYLFKILSYLIEERLSSNIYNIVFNPPLSMYDLCRIIRIDFPSFNYSFSNPNITYNNIDGYISDDLIHSDLQNLYKNINLDEEIIKYLIWLIS